jgi:hypothetical protein
MSALRSSTLVAAAAVVASASLIFPDNLPAQDETFRLAGRSVAIYNLAGTVTVSTGSGSDVIVTVRRMGADSDRLDIEAGSVDTRRQNWNTIEALRVIYPSDRVRYDGMRGQTQMRVRDDGTFWGGGRSDRGRRVEISDRGDGLEASADLRIEVPRGKRVLVALGAGIIEATNVSGDLYLDTGSGSISTAGTTGVLNLDTGSGDVSVDGADGDVNIDTGSGDVTVRSVRGPDLNVDTGSGEVRVDGVEATEINIDTGSGDVTVLGARTSDVQVDTGSGDVEVVLMSGSARFNVDTGSGDVTIAVPADYAGSVSLEMGSGDIVTDIPITVTRRDEDEIRGEIGTGGSGRIAVETGSGSIRLARS